MPRTLYGVGAHAGVVSDIQHALAAANFDPRGFDGVYGPNTAAAVKGFQQARGLSPTGTVDDRAWLTLMKCPIPGTDVRALELTAAFEGHGYTLAQGNWDGAWLTWGIIGFTLKHGEIQKIVLAIAKRLPDLVGRAFGENADDLLAAMNDNSRNQEKWADSISVNGGRLAEPWRTGFELFGNFPEVRDAQRQLAHTDFLVPSVKTAKSLSLKSELGLALCFDIHVQNGGVAPGALDDIHAAAAANPPRTESELRTIIANAVAEHSNSRFIEDVRQRKLAIALGSGTIHEARFTLENWGLGEDPAPELS